MELSLQKQELFEYTKRQLDCFFPDKYLFDGTKAKAGFDLALERTEECFKVISHPGYSVEKNGTRNAYFSHLHADQYATFVWFLANSLWRIDEDNKVWCDKLLQLNRVLFDLFISYKCRMPDHFFLGHPFGTILGNADYGDYLAVSQGVTVNTSVDSIGNPAPKIGKGLFLAADAKIIGNAPIGDRCSIGVDAFLFQKEVPSDSVVVNVDGKTEIRKRRSDICQAQKYFNVII